MSSLEVQPAREDGFARKKWTVDECLFLVESGLLEAGKFELIEGEIIFKMGQGRLHVAVITRIIAVLSALFGAESVQSQAPIGIGEIDPFSDPEPDVAVLRGTVDDYIDREPRPREDLLLVVEAAKTTVVGDTTTKARIYAEKGIQEYWVVNIPGREVIVFRHPLGDAYTEVTAFGEDATLSPLSKLDTAVAVRDLLPPLRAINQDKPL